MATASVGKVSHKTAIQKLHLLIALHPDAERKIGSGIDHFKVERNVLGAGQDLGSFVASVQKSRSMARAMVASIIA
ncbi:DUF3223 domain-containing protein [Pseudomonas aeruginosa]|uniref:DUF3223 domain-containing protein n=1 Tax=Pseudomonas aeruginosa TaxID=287 RepID=UPI00163C708B|nr:DUF3223 domain-containing protein [Pseudomonas aeruginosa]MBH4087093.1 DUF3223 domain-containing protein [Pseudomonas aeruginosa]HEH9457443.1 DUF3223 domain-containing protein [Pseudomonas aeruginosa]